MPSAITWTNVDLSSLRSSDVHLRAISLEISQPSVTKISLKIIFLRFYWNLPGTNELSVNSCGKIPFRLWLLSKLKRTLSSEHSTISLTITIGSSNFTKGNSCTKSDPQSASAEIWLYKACFVDAKLPIQCMAQWCQMIFYIHKQYQNCSGSHHISYQSHQISYQSHHISYQSHHISYQSHQISYQSHHISYQSHQISYKYDLKYCFHMFLIWPQVIHSSP